MTKLTKKEYLKLVKMALREDVGSGDITTEAIIDRDTKGKAVILVKEDGVIAGLEIAAEVFRQLDKKLKVILKSRDGAFVKKGTVVAEIYGSLRVILTGERIALNFLQHLSGIATLTRNFKSQISNLKNKVRILDTRKTLPGWRLLEKYAVKMGGGINHRMGLYDRVLIKDNHIAAVGGIRQAISKQRQNKKTWIEIETTNLEEVRQAIMEKVDRILLDNMPLKILHKSVKLCKKAGIETEASGSVSLQTVVKIAQTGVDYISIGALTHSSKALDISLEVTIKA